MYGASRQLVDLVEGVREHGVHPIVGLPSNGLLGKALAAHGIETVAVPDRRWTGKGWRFFRRYARTLSHSGSVARLMKDLGVDLVHTNTSISALGAVAAKRAGLPHVWHFHELQFEWLAPRASAIRRTVATTVSRTTDNLVVPSRDLARRIRPYVPNLPIDVVPNGLLRGPRPEVNFDGHRWSGPVRLLVVGRPKGWVTALKCLQELQSRGLAVRLTFAGDGPDRLMTEAKRAALELGVLAHVHFLGYVDDPSPLYRGADALLFPSEYESFGRVAVEAMAAGCPVVASRVGGLGEILDEGRTGWLVDVGDAKAMAEAVLQIVREREAVTPVLREAFEEAWNRYSIERFGREFAAIYGRCLA